ncbi:MAG: lysoplasmalogenase [Chloroflexi bacterium]|nr:lysoplasmalogenase [Chloroflexota bacterium]
MFLTLLWIALIIALLDWIAVARQVKTLEYFAKPAVMLALLAWMAVNGALSGHLVWFALGLLFSMGGDIALMLPKEQFILGLISFLIAHLAYLVGFNQTLPALSLPTLIMAVLVGVTAARLYRAIAAGLAASGRNALRTPVLAYSSVISLMLLSALLTLVRPEWEAVASLFAGGGAILFFLSDSILALNKFVRPIQNGRLIVIITYHLGQALIIYGAMSQFL